jgi:hypothetical protein
MRPILCGATNADSSWGIISNYRLILAQHASIVSLPVFSIQSSESKTLLPSLLVVQEIPLQEHVMELTVHSMLSNRNRHHSRGRQSLLGQDNRQTNHQHCRSWGKQYFP